MPICDGNAVPGKRSVLARVTFARWLCRSPAAAMLAMGLLASSPLSAQTITIDSVPPYGAPGSISGRPGSGIRRSGEGWSLMIRGLRAGADGCRPS